MNRFSLRAFLLLGALAALSAAPALAEGRDDYERDFSRTLTAKPGQRLDVDHSQGALRIRTHPGSDVQVRAHIEVSTSATGEAKTFGEGIAITVEEAAGAIVVRTRYPEKKWHFTDSGFVSYSVDYDIVMPETMPLSARNRFGDISVENLKANGTISNANGKVVFRNGRGEQKLENAFGAIELLGNAGSVDVTGANGQVSVVDVTGAAQIRNRFGKVEAARIQGKLTISGSNGAAIVTDVKGPVSVTNSFGSVEARNIGAGLEVENGNGAVNADTIKGPATVRSSFGSVILTGIAGDATVHNTNGAISVSGIEGSADLRGSFAKVSASKIKKGLKVVAQNAPVQAADVDGAAFLKTSFGPAEAERIGGDLTVENSNGAVKGSAIKGSANVRTSFGSVWLDGVAGKIDVDNSNGSIEVRASSTGTCAPISLETSFGGIIVRVPETAGYTVDARTSFGKIKSDLPLTVAGSTSTEALNGRIGNGQCPLTLANSNGGIELLKAPK
jgi:hypothetical protein